MNRQTRSQLRLAVQTDHTDVDEAIHEDVNEETHEDSNRREIGPEQQIVNANVLRTRNIQTHKQSLSAEEQIIRKRGRRHSQKPQSMVNNKNIITPISLMRTPPKRSSLKRQSDSNQSVKESPFTKCLRGIISPINHSNDLSSSTLTNSSSSSLDLSTSSSSTSIIKRVLRSSDLHKEFYYSPHPPYNLRSRDVSNDSGIMIDDDEVTPNPSSGKNNNQSTNIRRINRVRRRFNFD